MSHTVTVPTDIKCSLSVLMVALRMINPAWSRFLDLSNKDCVSPEGTLVARNPYLQRNNPRHANAKPRPGQHIVIPSSYNGADGASDLPYADLGFKRGADGKWIIDVDPSGAAKYVHNLQNTVTAVVKQMNAIAKAKLFNGTTHHKELDIDGAKSTTIISMDVETDPKHLA